MPKRPSANVKGKYIELRPELAEGMEELARQNRRTFREEVEHAFERHLAAPPVVTVQVTVLDLPATTIEAQEEPPTPTKRGRRGTGTDNADGAGKPARKRGKGT